MKIGLYFGSFNPIHHAHLIIASHVLNEGCCEKLWFIVSPQNPFKETRSLLNENQRLFLVRLAIEADPRMRALDIEFNLPRPSYTAVTLASLSEKYPEHDFSLIMGSDSFQNLHKWHNTEYIINNYNINIYKRPGFDILDDFGAKIKILNAPLLELSASTIRQLIREKKSIRYLMPENVIEEIEKGGYYRK
ncbi:nicotinate (nicotinamide) nucleotide adenylyltransferase [Niabella terrae]